VSRTVFTPDTDFGCPQDFKRSCKFCDRTWNGAAWGRQHYLRWCPKPGLIGRAADWPMTARSDTPTKWAFGPALVSVSPLAVIAGPGSTITRDTSAGHGYLPFWNPCGYEVMSCLTRSAAHPHVPRGGWRLHVPCHNTTLRDASFVREYERILDMLVPSDRFDWQSS